MSREWERGFAAGYAEAHRQFGTGGLAKSSLIEYAGSFSDAFVDEEFRKKKKRKRKLSAWNKYVKANANKPRFKYKSGAKKGKLNLKKMAVAFRKTPAGKKSKR
jgi:hypothetical protein